MIPPEENKPPEVDLSEIREVVNDLVNNVDKLFQDDLDVVDSSTTELHGKENDFEGSDQSATQVKMTHEIEELRKNHNESTDRYYTKWSSVLHK